MVATNPIPKEFLVERVGFIQIVQVPRMLKNLPCTNDMSYSLRPVHPRGPIDAKVVRELFISPIRQQLTPDEDIALGIEGMLIRGSPRPDQDLEDGVEPVKIRSDRIFFRFRILTVSIWTVQNQQQWYRG